MPDDLPLPEDPLQTALSAYHALNAELRWEFLKEIAADPCHTARDADGTSFADVPSDDPYWDEYKEILSRYREPEIEE